jgi:amidase
MSTLNDIDAIDQAARISSGEVSAREMVMAAIAQAEHLNSHINAIIHPRFERALAEADAGLPSGPFTGVPLVLKDLGAPLAGEQLSHTKISSRRFCSYWPYEYARTR